MKVVLALALCSLALLVRGQGNSDIFFTYGTSIGDSTLFLNDDSYSSAIPLSIPFTFFAGVHSQLFVCTNGILSFGFGVSTFTPSPFPIANNPVVAPFWGDVDTNRGGNIYYREVTDARTMRDLSTAIVDYFGPQGQTPSDFEATWAFLTTWDNVAAYGGGGPRNTFQAALVSDGTYSYVIFNYREISWTYGSASGGVPAQIGFDAGDRVSSFAIPTSRTADIVNVVSDSNVDTPGRWMFRVDLAEIVDGGSEPVCETEGACGPHQREEANGDCTSFAPRMALCPNMEGPVVGSQNHFHFTCAFGVTLEEGRSLTEYGIRVRWLFNGRPTGIELTDTPAMTANGLISVQLLHSRLIGSEHMGRWMSCEVSTYWTATPAEESAPLRSNGYWLGCKAVTVDAEGALQPVRYLEVDEADDEATNVFLYCTLPFVCRTLTDCDHRFMIYSPNALLVHQDLGFNCSYDFQGEDWSGEDNRIFNGDYPLEVRTISTPTTEPPMLDFIEFVAEDAPNTPSYLRGYAPPSISVYRYNDEQRLPSFCIASADPRMTTFDRTHYNFNARGQFLFARSSSGRGFEVDIRTHECDRAATASCVCGVAMREGDEVYIMSMCHPTDFRSGMNYNGRGLGQQRDLTTNGWNLNIDRAGHFSSITTPGGANLQIYLYDWGMNVYLTVIGADYERLDGLCGTYNGNANDDLRYFTDEAQTQTAVASASDDDELDTFVQAWRMPRGTSYFEVEPPSVEQSPVDNRRSFCTCVAPEDETATITRCEAPVNPGPPTIGTINIVMNLVGSATNMAAPNFGGRSNNLPPGLGNRPPGGPLLFGRKKRQIDESDDFDYAEDSTNLNQNTFPTPSGINEEEANAYCSETLTGGCGDSTIDAALLAGIVQNCVQDVRDMDSMDGVSDVYIGETQFTCITQLVQTVNNMTNENSTIAEVINAVVEMIGPMVSSLCPADCNHRGVCANTECICDEEWTGSDCSIDQSALPAITGFPYGDVCDRDSQGCSIVTARATNIYQSDTLLCKVEADGQVYTLPGMIRTYFLIECDLPDVISSNLVDYSISITLDGENYGVPASYRVYDSDCLTCTSATEECTINTDTCSISGTCYNRDVRNLFALCYRCMPDTIQTQFTREEDCVDAEAGVAEWGEFGDYSRCAVTCDYGFIYRYRYCLVPDTCYSGSGSEREVCINYRCEEDDDEVDNGLLVVMEGSTDETIAAVLDAAEDVRTLVAERMNDYCAEYPEDCCDVIDVEAVRPSMSVFTSDNVAIAAGTLTPNTEDDTTSMRVAVSLTRSTLESACGGIARRRRRTASLVYIPVDIVEEALLDSWEDFEDFDLVIVDMGEDEGDSSAVNSSDKAATIGMAVGLVLAAVVIVAVIAIVIYKKTSKNSTPVEPMANPNVVTTDHPMVAFKHKMVMVAPPSYSDPDGLDGTVKQAPPSYNTWGHKFFA